MGTSLIAAEAGFHAQRSRCIKHMAWPLPARRVVGSASGAEEHLIPARRRPPPSTGGRYTDKSPSPPLLARGHAPRRVTGRRETQSPSPLHSGRRGGAEHSFCATFVTMLHEPQLAQLGGSARVLPNPCPASRSKPIESS